MKLKHHILGGALLALVAAAAMSGSWEKPADAAGNDIAAVSAAEAHTCALRTNGGMWCWGENGNGQLGDDSTNDSTFPVTVSGLSTGAAVAIGGFHSCVITTSGGLKCWGRNQYGKLGNGTGLDSHTPGNVTGLTSGVASVEPGFDHTCALTTGGGAKCWGEGGYGGLGHGSFTDSSTPVNVSGLTSGVAAVASGGYHACALTTGGGVKCWGYNVYGQLGNGTLTGSTTPVDVSGLSSGVSAIAAGTYHTCAITTGGAVKCWGINGSGQLGDGSATPSSVPVDVSGLSSGVASIAGGGAHTCAVTTGGGVKCWGSNVSGQLGNGIIGDSHTPVDVTGLTSGVASVATGGQHTCARTDAGGLKCWGNNLSGQLGDGTTTNSNVPLTVTGLGFKKDPDADTDGDTIPNGTDPNDDNDGCTDVQEFGAAGALGGLRNPHNFWDFFDVPASAALTRDGDVTGLDIFAVLARFNATDSGPGDFNRNSDPFSTPNQPVTGAFRANYHPAYDLGALVGTHPWDRGPPDGSITGVEIFASIAQFGHSCG